MADYNFPYTDTASDSVNAPLLEGQILDSSMTQAAKDALGDILADDDSQTLTVTFGIALSAPDEAELDSVVAAHDGDVVISERTQAVRVPAEQSTSSAAYEQIGAPWTPQPLTGGRWQLTVSSEVALENGANFGSGTPDRTLEFRLMMDTGGGPIEIAEIAWPFDRYHDWAFIGSEVFNAGAQPTFTIEGRVVGAADTAKIRRLSVILQRIAERA